MAITLDGSDNKIAIGANATGSAYVRLYEDTDNGTNYVDIIAPASITNNRTLTLPDATGTLLTNSGTEAGAFSTLSVNSNNISAENSLGFRNRIINGDMRIDQRNAGASVTPTASGYTLDRWRAGLSVSSKFSVQQSSTAPTGFKNSLLVTSLSAYSVGSGELFGITQRIEGFNTADLMWGTANAKTVTVSFWVRSSLTGNFGGSLYNGNADRFYPFTYAISAANTFEYKTVTVAGDTTGTWATDNTTGLQIIFGLGMGSSISGTAGAWTGSTAYVPTSSVSVVGTSGATWYITGAQLEVGSVATPFERRDYGRELIMCQRYFQEFVINTYSYVGATFTTSDARTAITLMTTMRAAPTGIATTGTVQFCTAIGVGSGSVVFGNATQNTLTINSSGATGLASAGGSSFLRGTGTIQMSAEL